MERFDVRARLSFLRGGCEDTSSALGQFCLPLGNLVRVHIKAFGQYGQRLVTLEDSDRHLGLECGGMVSAGSSHTLCFFGHVGPLLQRLHLSCCPIFRGPLFGRPYVCGLAAGGQAGVERALQILREELVRDMRLLGTLALKTSIRALYTAVVVLDRALPYDSLSPMRCNYYLDAESN